MPSLSAPRWWGWRQTSMAGKDFALKSIRILTVLVVLGSLMVGTAGPARADRCEPSELVVRHVVPTYEEPLEEDEKEYCRILLEIYRIAGCYDTTLLICLDQLGEKYAGRPLPVECTTPPITENIYLCLQKLQDGG